MKKLLLVSMLLISVSTFSQDNPAINKRLIEAVNTFSAATLYNTYAVIGSVGDGFAKNVYDEKTVEQLMAAQKSLAGNLVRSFEGLVRDSILVSEQDRSYALSAVGILNGLKLQAELLQEFADTNSNKKRQAYEDQRKKNWSAIARLMGIKE